MSDLEKEFEERFKNEWFSNDWSEIAFSQKREVPLRKDLATLQNELEQIEETIEAITQKELRLRNLSMLYKI